MHDVIIVGIPLLAILAGILFGRNDIKELRSEMRSEIQSLRSEMISGFNRVDSRFDRVDADLRQFHFITGKLEGRMESLEKRT